MIHVDMHCHDKVLHSTRSMDVIPPESRTCWNSSSSCCLAGNNGNRPSTRITN
ncbi:unnamed protein product [Penicillium salamii]|nr:unnamed protein product [Penicillium salamii]